jgi:hypothetical protein
MFSQTPAPVSLAKLPTGQLQNRAKFLQKLASTPASGLPSAASKVTFDGPEVRQNPAKQGN